MKPCAKCGDEMTIVVEDKHIVIYECAACGHRVLKPARKRQRPVGPSEVK